MIRHFSHMRLAEAETFITHRLSVPKPQPTARKRTGLRRTPPRERVFVGAPTTMSATSLTSPLSMRTLFFRTKNSGPVGRTGNCRKPPGEGQVHRTPHAGENRPAAGEIRGLSSPGFGRMQSRSSDYPRALESPASASHELTPSVSTSAGWRIRAKLALTRRQPSPRGGRPERLHPRIDPTGAPPARRRRTQR